MGLDSAETYICEKCGNKYYQIIGKMKKGRTCVFCEVFYKEKIPLKKIDKANIEKKIFNPDYIDFNEISKRNN